MRKSCVSSLAAVTLFSWIGPLLAGAAARSSVGPCWTLGLLFGLGGLIGTYTGARLQRFLPARAIEIVLAIIVTALGILYLAQAIR